MRYWQSSGVLAIIALVLMGWSSKALSQYDYVPGMKNFPDIDITHYNLCAEFSPDSPDVKAKAVVEFQTKEKRSDFVVFEIDRRVRISKAEDGEGNSLKFKQPVEADYVIIYLAESIKEEEITKIKLEYVCSFPALQEIKAKPKLITEPRQGIYFFLRKWYPVNDYYADQAPADFTFTLPKNYEVLTSGLEVSVEIQADKKISRWRSFGSLNYYFVFAGPFRRYAYEDQAPKVVIYMDTKEPDVANAAKEKAIHILRYYGILLCPYPYPVLYLVTSHTRIKPMGLNGITYIDPIQFSQKYIYSNWTWSHELAHNWFGGIVRSKDPEDYCFLIESPAEYWSRLYIRLIRGEERYRLDLELQRMISLSGNEIVPISKYYTLEKGGDFLYAKGFYVYHMLRHIMGDEKFFSMMRKLVQKFYMKPAGIRDLQKLAEELYGQPLGWFFDQWLFEKGIPEYEMDYNIEPREKGKYEVSGRIKQKLVNFRMPVEILALSKDYRYTHKILVENHEVPFQFEVFFKPDKVLFDPEFKILRWDEGIKVWLYTAKGRKLIISKKYEEAAKLLDRALAMNPGCSWAAFEKGHLAYIQEQYGLAIQCFNQALNGDLDFRMITWPPEQIKQIMYLVQGISYDSLGKRQEAVSCYQKVIEMERDSRFPFYYDDAKKYIEKPFSEKKQ